MSIYNPERQWPRLVPENAVMVSIFAGVNQAFGLLANISVSGASVVSGVQFETGSSILLRIEFEAQARPFSTEAKVIWSRDDTPPKQPASFVHGVRFVLITKEQRAELEAFLSRPDFRNPVIPGKSGGGSGELDAMINDLSEDLEELGEKVAGDLESS